MDFEYDVVIIGGAFSGAATALMLKRKRPDARVLIIEKTAEFDRKVGESTTEVSSCYMTKILGLTHYLGHHQLAKQGLRLWFSNRAIQWRQAVGQLGMGGAFSRLRRPVSNESRVGDQSPFRSGLVGLDYSFAGRRCQRRHCL